MMENVHFNISKTCDKIEHIHTITNAAFTQRTHVVLCRNSYLKLENAADAIKLLHNTTIAILDIAYKHRFAAGTHILPQVLSKMLVICEI